MFRATGVDDRRDHNNEMEFLRLEPSRTSLEIFLKLCEVNLYFILNFCVHTYKN